MWQKPYNAKRAAFTMPNNSVTDHLLVETPEGNLVAGMKWLQGTYTMRKMGIIGAMKRTWRGACWSSGQFEVTGDNQTNQATTGR